MSEDELLAEIQGGRDICEPHRLEKELLASAGEKFSLRKDSRSRAPIL